MSAFEMPPHLMMLFAPRPPLDFEPPITKRKPPPYSGMVQYIDLFETEAPPPKGTFETPKERRARQKEERAKAHAEKLAEKVKEYDPTVNPKATKDPYSTLFVGRISYETTEKKLRREFEEHGPIRQVKIVTDKTGRSRGYAFVEFEYPEDMKDAYKLADGRKIDGRRVLVDVERGRTVQGWLPRRLGGGRGPQRLGVPKKKGLAANGPGPGHFAGVGGFRENFAGGGPPRPFGRGPPPGGRPGRFGDDHRVDRGGGRREDFGGPSYSGGGFERKHDRGRFVGGGGGGGNRFSGTGANTEMLGGRVPGAPSGSSRADESHPRRHSRSPKGHRSSRREKSRSRDRSGLYR